MNRGLLEVLLHHEGSILSPKRCPLVLMAFSPPHLARMRSTHRRDYTMLSLIFTGQNQHEDWRRFESAFEKWFLSLSCVHGRDLLWGMNGLKEAFRSYLRVTDMYSISCFPERYIFDRFHIEKMSLWHIRLVPILAYERRSISNLPSGGASVCRSTISPKPIFL